jgi:hypothetical protein
VHACVCACVRAVGTTLAPAVHRAKLGRDVVLPPTPGFPAHINTPSTLAAAFGYPDYTLSDFYDFFHDALVTCAYRPSGPEGAAAVLPPDPEAAAVFCGDTAPYLVCYLRCCAECLTPLALSRARCVLWVVATRSVFRLPIPARRAVIASHRWPDLRPGVLGWQVPHQPADAQ